MAPAGCRAGTIFFLENMILVETTSKEEDISKGNAPHLKVPLLRSPSPLRSSGQSPTTDLKPVRSPRSLSPLKLPSLVECAQPASPGEELAGAHACRKDHNDFILPHLPTKPRSPKRNMHRLDPNKRPGRSLRLALVGQATLAEFCHAKDAKCGIVCRESIEQELHKLQASRMQNSNRRREVARLAGVSQRARVRTKENQRTQEQRTRKNKLEHDSPLRDLPAPAESLPGTPDGSPHRSERLSGSGPTLHVSTTESPIALISTEQPTFKSLVLRKMKQRKNKNSRLSTLRKSRDISKNDAYEDHQTQEYQIQFDSLPASEQEALINAYQAKSSNWTRGGSITPANCNARLLERYHPASKLASQDDNERNLYKCLKELGLDGKTEVEQKEIKILCHEAQNRDDDDFYIFCFELVPLARSKLMELQQEELSEQFAYYDRNHSGFLDKGECLSIFRKACKSLDSVGLEEVRREFNLVFDRVKLVEREIDNGMGHVDFEGFQSILQRVREKCECVRRERERNIIEKHALSPEEAHAYAEELLMLHEIFVSLDTDANGLLNISEVFGALLEQGLMPYDAQERGRTERMVRHVFLRSSSPGLLPFTSFLALVRSLREQSRKNARQDLLDYYRKCDKDGDGLLSFAEASGIFEKLGMVPQCRDDQDEMKNMLLKVDVDNSGYLDCQEFAHLVQLITERIRANQRRREAEVAKHLGFREQQVAELREVFFNLDTQGTGDLGVEECRKALTLLRVDMTAEELKELMASTDRKRKGRIDMVDFFHFIHAISSKHPKALRRLPTFKV